MQNRLKPSAGVVVVVSAMASVTAWLALSETPPKPAEQVVVPQPRLVRKDAMNGLDNLWQMTLPDGKILFSGGQPHGDAGFESLQKLGVQTVLSVDGAAPDVDEAKRCGLRYVHVPIGYDGVPEDRLATMVAAIRQLPGPVYVHCHHGKHRGPSAAVCIWRALDSRVAADQATEALHEMGTAEKYQGLYKAARRPFIKRPETANSAIEFPEISPVPPLAEQMVGIDRLWEELKSAGANRSEEIDAMLVDLAERFQESARLSEQADAGFDPRLVEELQSTAKFLESRSSESLQETLSSIDSRCKSCHERFRD